MQFRGYGICEHLQRSIRCFNVATRRRRKRSAPAHNDIVPEFPTRLEFYSGRSSCHGRCNSGCSCAACCNNVDIHDFLGCNKRSYQSSCSSSTGHRSCREHIHNNRTCQRWLKLHPEPLCSQSSRHSCRQSCSCPSRAGYANGFIRRCHQCTHILQLRRFGCRCEKMGGGGADRSLETEISGLKWWTVDTQKV